MGLSCIEQEQTSYKALVIPEEKGSASVKAKQVSKIPFEVAFTSQTNPARLIGVPTTSSSLVKNSYRVETQVVYSGKFYGSKVDDQVNTSNAFQMQVSTQNDNADGQLPELDDTLKSPLKTRLLDDAKQSIDFDTDRFRPTTFACVKIIAAED